MRFNQPKRKIETSSGFDRLEKELADVGLTIGFTIRKRIQTIPIRRRGDIATSFLKPPRSTVADVEGEKVGLYYLRKLSKKLRKKVRIIINPEDNELVEIGSYEDSESVWCVFDPIDGTIKVSGLGNNTEKGIYRVGNNGCWATGIAFTLPTAKDLAELSMGDFVISAIVDGNPTIYRAYPTNAVVYPDLAGRLLTYEIEENTGLYHRLGTSSQTDLSQSTILFDSFQAYDRKTANRGSEALAVSIFSKVANRNEGGAFDIVRLYANIGEILRQILERAEEGLEPQGVGSISINENLPNLVPIRSVIEGAGGYVVDFDGNEIRDKHLSSGRQNVIAAANRVVRDRLLDIVSSVCSH